MNTRFGIETAQDIAEVNLTDAQCERLSVFVQLLTQWQEKQNLVSRATLSEVWTRHIADSLQLLPLIAGRFSHDTGEGVKGVDLGSGGGLPGAVLALASDTGAVHGDPVPARCKTPSLPVPVIRMTLIEATHRKVAFLRAVSRETRTAYEVLPKRLESLAVGPIPPARLVTARALAPLADLVQLADPWLKTGAIAFFHKGGEYARELADWPDAGRHDVVLHKSAVDADSRILEIKRQAALTDQN